MNSAGSIFPNNYESSLSDDDSLLTEQHHNYENLPSDAMHIIFQYHIFPFATYGSTVQLEAFPTCDTQSDISTSQNPEWIFLQMYAHCVKFVQTFTEENFRDTSWVITFYEFLEYCWHPEHNHTYHYMDLRHISPFSVLLQQESEKYWRGVPKLELDYSGALEDSQGFTQKQIISSLQNVRGVDTLHLNMGRLIFTSASFPNLRGVKNLSLRHYEDIDSRESQPAFRNLCGLKSLDMSDCEFHSDFSVLEYCRGIESLKLSFNISISLCSQEFQNLRGIRSLTISDQSLQFTDQVLEQLRGVEELIIHDVDVGCSELTDLGFQNLRGVKVLNLSNSTLCCLVTDSAFTNLRGIKSLTFTNMNRVTDAIFEQLRGIKELDIRNVAKMVFSADTLKNLRGVRSLKWYDRDRTNDLEKRLGDRCLEQLYGVQILHLDNVITISDHAFRHLKHVTELVLEGKGGREPLAQSVPLGDAAFSQLENVEIMELKRLKLDVSNFCTLIEKHMPRLEYLEAQHCLVLNSLLEALNQEEEPICVSIHESMGTHALASFCIEDY